jgi:hypothetical protein
MPKVTGESTSRERRNSALAFTRADMSSRMAADSGRREMGDEDCRSWRSLRIPMARKVKRKAIPTRITTAKIWATISRLGKCQGETAGLDAGRTATAAVSGAKTIAATAGRRCQGWIAGSSRLMASSSSGAPKISVDVQNAHFDSSIMRAIFCKSFSRMWRVLTRWTRSGSAEPLKTRSMNSRSMPPMTWFLVWAGR